MFFREKYNFLSNMYECKVVDELGVIYPSVENAYQASKSDDIRVRNWIAGKTPKESKALGRRIDMRKDFELNKLNIMYDLVLYKFSNDISLAEKLLAIEGEIVEDNYWGDKFWGKCNGIGKNWLGNILMRVREELSK